MSETHTLKRVSIFTACYVIYNALDNTIITMYGDTENKSYHTTYMYGSFEMIFV
jgi:hypothetical protein